MALGKSEVCSTS